MEQLRAMLREVLKEELAPITDRLDRLESRFDGLENHMSEIKEQLDRMERAQAEDVIAMLHVIDKNITNAYKSA